MTPKVKGSHPWLVVLCVPSGQATLSQPDRAYFEGFMAQSGAGGLIDFWSQVSRQKLDLTGSRILGWYPLSQSVAQINALTRSQAAALARAAATAAGEDISGYQLTLAFLAETNHFGEQGRDVTSGVFETRGQPSWRWCGNCEALTFWDGSRQPGPCIAGGRHAYQGSGVYAVGLEAVAGGESGWRWCNRCEGLVFSIAPPAPCHAGGNHSFTGSGSYALRIGPAGSHEQNDWRRCTNCQGLVLGRNPGRCPAGGGHAIVGSPDYAVRIQWSASVGSLAHETGHAFGLQHAFGPSRSGNFVNDGRPGAYDDRTCIMGTGSRLPVPRYSPAWGGLGAANLVKLGWLDEEEIIRVSSGSHAVTLVPLYGTVEGPRVVQAVRASGNRTYTVALRTAAAWDEGLGSERVTVQLQRSLYAVGQDCWRRCSRCQGMVFAGRMLCPAGGVHEGSGSGDYGLLLGVGPNGGQNNWRFCRRCSGLFFAGHGNGHCPAGGEHTLSGSGDYTLVTTGPGQPGWRWCRKCQGLIFGGEAMLGSCPGGGLHDHEGSGNYVLSTGGGPNRQNRWRNCAKCQGLFFAFHGSCSGGDVHVPEGLDYSLTANLDVASGQSNWKACARCGGLAYHDGTRPAGACAASGTHDHSASGHYTLPIDAETASSQWAWFECTKCSALHFVDATRGPGRCIAGGTHTSRREYTVPVLPTSVPGLQGFRWCRKCECMVLGDNPAGCAVGGAHDTSGSGGYVVRQDPAALYNEASFWRSCLKCSVLMRLATADASNENPCPAGGRHAPQGEFFLTFRTGHAFWRWCRKCEALAYWDTSSSASTPGPCPAGATHDHSGSANYAPPNFDEAVQVVAADLRAGDRYSAADDGVTIEVTTVGPLAADVRVTT